MAGGSEHLQRGLGERHIRLMALGSAIGVGLFLGAGSAIKMAGPAIMGWLALLTICYYALDMRSRGPVSYRA